MRVLRFIWNNMRGTALILPVLIGICLLVVASHTEDPDAAACTSQGGEASVDPGTRTSGKTHVCIVNGVIVNVWRRVNGKNEIVWGY